mgnify:FL=1
MDFFIGTIFLTGLFVLFVACFLFYSNNDNCDPSIPYANYGSYPIIGHLIAFSRDRTKLLLECSKRYGSCFRIKVLNQSFIIIPAHNDWTTIVRSQSFKFSPEEFGMRLFGLSSSLVSKYNCKRQPNNYKYTYFILAQSEFDEDTHRLYVLHLKNRDGLHSIVAEFLNRIRQLMTNDKEEIEKNGDVSKWISCGLLELSHHMLYQPSTLALIGEINPASLENDFSTFDKNFHYFFIPFPQWIYSWFFSPVLQARTRLNESWLKNPEPLKASDFHRDRIALLSSYSQWISKQDYGAFLTGFMWASLGNTIPGVFWSLFYILRDKQALETIKQEMDTHILDDNWIQPEQLDACVYLESAINETLRLVGAPFMTRKCIRQAEVHLQDGRTITVKPNETLAWFGAVSHYDDRMFPNADKFIFDRFLNRKADTVPGYMPFGAGKSICPGRFFAKYEIKTCVAVLLRYMEYKLENVETVPPQIQSRIGVGIAPPSKDIPILYRYKSSMS